MDHMRMPVVMAAASLLLASACAHPQARKDEPTPAVAAAAPRTSSPAPVAPATSGDKACDVDLDCGSRQLCLRGRCADISENLPECGPVTISFPYDSAAIPEEALSELGRRARCLQGDQALHVRVEGNTDERGTEEYNVALGEQRARSVADHLRRLGVSDAQLDTVSYGEIKPVCTGHDEDCWAKNRRAALKMGRRPM